MATILGTRPEIIRLSRVMSELDRRVEHSLIHTGQNYDHDLSQIFFEEMGLRRPDFLMEVNTSSLGQVLGGILIETERLLNLIQPDAVLILGDTNSSIAGIVAKRLKIPLYHMEAGNRCFDENVPEEINRRLIDHLADFNLVYTEHARRHILSEGFPHRRVYLTGSPMREVLMHYRPKIDASEALSRLGLSSGRYLLVSMHREENVDDRQHLMALIRSLNELAELFSMPVIVSTHPRTRNRLAAIGTLKLHDLVSFLKPFGFFDYIHLQENAFCVLSDSGTITEEASILGFPAVTIREAMERPEGMDSGSIVLCGLEQEGVVEAVATVTAQRSEGRIPPVPLEYEVTNVSQRVVNLIIGTARLSNSWAGIKRSL